MKKYTVILGLIFLYLVSCVTEKESAKNIPTDTIYNSEILYPSLSNLKLDLMKTAQTILLENQNAVRTTNDTINMGKGGYLGTGQFYGYTWQLKNNKVDQVNYIMEFSLKDYDEWVRKTTTEYGKGIDLNGKGFAWLIPEMGGITLLLINGDNRLILASVGIGYVDIF